MVATRGRRFSEVTTTLFYVKNYQYDNNGNMTQEYNLGNSRTFTCNPPEAEDNRLIEVDDNINGGHVQYVYDAVGRRLIRKDLDSGVWTKYYYDGLTVVAEKQSTDGGQNWSWKRIMGTGRGVIGNVFSISTYNATSWVDEYPPFMEHP